MIFNQNTFETKVQLQLCFLHISQKQYLLLSRNEQGCLTEINCWQYNSSMYTKRNTICSLAVLAFKCIKVVDEANICFIVFVRFGAKLDEDWRSYEFLFSN